MHGSLLSVSSRGAVVYTFKLRKHAQCRLIQLRTDKSWCLDQFWANCAPNAPDSNWIPVKLNLWAESGHLAVPPSQFGLWVGLLKTRLLLTPEPAVHFFPRRGVIWLYGRPGAGSLQGGGAWLGRPALGAPMPQTRSALGGSRAHGASSCPSPPLATLRSGLIFITVVYALFELSLVSLSSFALKSPRFYSAGKFIVPYIRAQPQTFKVTPIHGSC